MSQLFVAFKISLRTQPSSIYHCRFWFVFNNIQPPFIELLTDGDGHVMNYGHFSTTPSAQSE